jgi:hypothetical protein
MTPLAEAGFALAVLAVPVAVLTLWMLRLNHRDRRAAAIRATIGACCSELGLRGMIAVDVGAGVWTRRARVTLDMRLCGAEQVWLVIARAHTLLPTHATLRVVTTNPAPTIVVRGFSPYGRGGGLAGRVTARLLGALAR